MSTIQTPVAPAPLERMHASNGVFSRKLMPGEVLVYRTRRHWIGMALAACTFVLGFIPQVGFVPPAAIFLGSVIAYARSGFAITNKRVLVRFGYTAFEIAIGKIENVTMEQSLLGRALGYGNVATMRSGGVREVFRSVADPLRLAEVLRAQMAAETDRT